MTTHLTHCFAFAAIATLAGCDSQPSARDVVAAGLDTSGGSGQLPDRIGMISDFENTGMHTPFGTDWREVNDKAGGGVSTADAEIVAGGANGTRHALHVHGKVSVGDYLFPMGGVGLPLGPVKDHIPKPVDISKYKGVQFWAKGDGKRYMLRVADEDVKDYNFHHYQFTTTADWQLVRIPFAELKQFDWGQRVGLTGHQVSSFLITNYSPPGEDFGTFEIFVDEISLF